MEFQFTNKAPTIFDGWLSKANIGIVERWQRRFFRLQGRCIYYFKKEQGEPECGNIPLIDVEVVSLPSIKNRTYGFSIKLPDTKLSKHAEYFLQADSDDARKQWIKIINENMAKSIVGKSFIDACNTSTNDPNAHLLLPYFIPAMFEVLDAKVGRIRSMWTDVKAESNVYFMNLMNLNYPIPTDDAHAMTSALLEYFRSLPHSLLASKTLDELKDDITPEILRKSIRERPAPIREFFKIIGNHFKRLLAESSKNGATPYTLIPFLGPLIVNLHKKSGVSDSRLHTIQDNVAQTFLSNVDYVLEDIHEFSDAMNQKVIKRARLSVTINHQGESILEAPRGLLVNVVREDIAGWCTVFTMNGKIGLIHTSNLNILNEEDEIELMSGPNIDELMDAVRENAPELILLFDGMIDEKVAIKRAIRETK